MSLKFQGWGLSASEAEVALFAIKGFQVAEIARLRGLASGTVRSQLRQVYAKAGVNSRSMLLALFFDDLLEYDVFYDEVGLATTHAALRLGCEPTASCG